jgi:3-phenylpropionate/trans-cinnamate dioxygenase ferredoxin reductase subunit
LVENGLKPGELHILSADSSMPYERPLLSKGFLAGKDAEASILISADDFYGKHGIESNSTALRRVSMGPENNSSACWRGNRIRKLVVATGAQVRKLDVHGVDLAGVYYLRTLEDSKREKEGSAKQVVIIWRGVLRWK